MLAVNHRNEDNEVMSRQAKLLIVTLVALSFAGCIKWFKGDVASGIARLTLRNMAAVVSIISKDTQCGFESEAVLDNPRIEGEVGGHGVVTWTTTECRLDLGDYTEVTHNCIDRIISAKGVITVTAEKIIEGRITGDPDQPVIPTDSFAATLNIIEARVEDFEVKDNGVDEYMEIYNGTLSGKVRPRLARSAGLGACAIITNNIQFEDITYGPSEVFVSTPSMDFDAKVQSSSISAMIGEGVDEENSISGTLTVWDSPEEVPNDGTYADPSYKQKRYRETYECLDDLALPVSYNCDITEMIGMGAARLSMQTMAGVVNAINSDEECGFSSPAVKDAVLLEGTVGEPGGVATFTVNNCTLDFAAPHTVSTNCQDAETIIQGRATVSGTMAIAGYLSGDPEEPAVPTTRDPARFDLTIRFDNWRTSSSATDQAIRVLSGTLSGVVQPRTAIDKELGVCSIATPVAELSQIQWQNGDVMIEADGLTFETHLTHSNLHAINGPKGAHENFLDGTINADGTDIAVPQNDQILDPNYEPQAFDLSYQCDDNMEVPESDADCSLDPMLAQNAARLVLQSFGMLATEFNNNETCGFAAIDSLLPENVSDAPNGEITAVWEVLGCTMGGGSGDPVLIDTDCNGKNTYMHGIAVADGTKTATGRLAAAATPIFPSDREGAGIEIHLATLDAYAVIPWDEGATEPGAYMTIHNATLSGVSKVIAGESVTDPGAFYIPTPVASLYDVRMVDAHVTVHAMGKQFNLYIANTNLAGFNGFYHGEGNIISGWITVNGNTYNIPVDPSDPEDCVLDPEFDQETFDASYVCREDLLEVVPWN